MNMINGRSGHRLMLALTALTSLLIAGCDLPASKAIDQAAFDAGEQLAINGREGVIACTACHGANGEGNWDTGFPRLAGLHPTYLVKQLNDFAGDPLDIGVDLEPIARDYVKTPRIYKDLTIYSPGIRTDAMMNDIGAALTAEEKNNLAVYYSNLAFETSPIPADFQSLERGLDLAQRGKPEYMMPRCDACHAAKGQGFGALFPPLAGQPPQYIISQINKWQSGERNNDNLSMMKNVATQLTAGDKINIAKYYANQSYRVNME
ncbi:MAG TPA: c-type cytochrome [Chromatiaceae bacterium]|nr:c-type cytochrome [Chromatiaceae bacterium]